MLIISIYLLNYTLKEKLVAYPRKSGELDLKQKMELPIIPAPNTLNLHFTFELYF